MSLQNLRSTLQKQVSAEGAITVSQATLDKAHLVPSPNFDTIIQSYLNLKGPLSVAVTGKIPAPSSRQLAVTGNASFLGISSASVKVVFTLQANNNVDALITATLPGDWKFSDSFPLMIGFPFEDMLITQSAYLLTTAAQTMYQWNDQQLTLKKGLNFVAFLGMGGPLKILRKLIGSLTPSEKIAFTGTIDPTGIVDPAIGAPAVSLSGAINGPITAKTHFDLSLPQALLTGSPDENGYMAYWLSIGTTLSVGGKPFSAFQAAIIQNSPILSFSMLPTTNAITPAEIRELIGGVDYAKLIPAELRDIFKSVNLVGLYAAINVETMDILALSGSIGAASPWTMGQFTIESVVLNSQVLMPFSAARTELAIFTAAASLFPSVFMGDFVFEISYDATGKEMAIAANFLGAVNLNDLVAGLSDKTITIPKNFDDIEFDDFGMSFTKAVSGYEYLLYGSAKGVFNVSILDSSLVATFEINVDSATKNYALGGGLTIGNSFFKATANLSGGKQLLSGSWTALNKDYLELTDIASAFDLELPEIPKGLDLALESASLTYDFAGETLALEAASANYGAAVFVAFKNTATQKWQFYFGLSVGKTINLSNLPLIDKALSPDETIEIRDVQVMIASAPLDPNKKADKQEIAAINKLIDKGYPAIPEQGLPGAVALAAQCDFGGTAFPLSISASQHTAAPAIPQPAALAAERTALIVSDSGSGAGSIPKPTRAADGTLWFHVQKSFGPVDFRKIDVRYRDGVLWFLLDAALTAAGLEISVIGLSVGSPLSTFDPEFNIEGLGVEYANAAVTIGGAFEKLPAKAPITLEFGGSATVQLKEFGIAAIGAYAQFDDQTSMFVFASVEGPFGGPGFFFVTGFCGGFGYNSKLRIPAQNEVYQFPFVKALSDPNVLGADPNPIDVLQKIMNGDRPWVAPSAGDIWLCAGIMFTTYEVVNSTALLVAEFGNTFQLALIGLSKARFPMEGPTVYAYTELQLEARFIPGDGVVSFTAVLSPNSYVLDKACHLTGGFALAYWYDPSPHAGDFVLTLGGYSPYFTPPDYYPQEPRLGFSWTPDAKTTISGSLYFALTPAAIMAGGSLEATYHTGNLKAWFTAYANIIMWYNPFHFVADIGVAIGVSYKVDLLFFSKTFSVELGADLTLWGPATGGAARIHWWVVSFTVDFGAERSEGLEKQTWSDFVKMLPSPDNVVKIVPVAGLQPAPPSAARTGHTNSLASAAPAPWLVRIDRFQFTTNASIPLTDLYIGDDKTPVKTGNALNIKPMETTGLTSHSTLAIFNKKNCKNVLDPTWGIEYVTSNVPSALWGTGSATTLPSGDQLITDQLTGFRITVPSPILGNGTGDISIKKDLQYDPLEPGGNPLQTGLAPQGPAPVTSNQTIADIGRIMSTAVKTRRDAIFDTFSHLGLQGLTNGDLAGLAKDAGAVFANEPLLIGTNGKEYGK